MQTRLSHVIFRMSVGAALAVNPIPTLAETIEETVIVADRVDTSSQSVAVSVNIIDRGLIEALGSATLPQLLKTQVGISTTQTGGLGAVSGVRIRGQDGFRTKATFKKRPNDKDDDRMNKLYNIRPFRRITKEDMNDIWPEWTPDF